MKNLSKLSKIQNLLLQLVIFAATYFFIYTQVFLKNDLPELWTLLKSVALKPGYEGTISIVIGLMLCNWFLEAVKWKYLIARIEIISFSSAVQAVFTGVSISTFTPNRVGEYIGRVFFLKKASRIEGILITMVGSMAQLLVTVLLGTIAILIFIPQYIPTMIFGHGYLYYALFILIVLLDFLLLSLFFNLSFLTTIKEKILRNRMNRIQKFFRVFAFYHNRELATVLTLSLTRYFVFSSQFIIMIRFFGIPISYFDAIVLIALIYFIMTAIPTIALTELGLRGSVSLYFFGFWLSKTNPSTDFFNAGVLGASVFLWMINLGIPAVIGTIFVFRLRFFRKPN